jgi:hypothetical protein
MTEKLLPFLATRVENGVLLYYIVLDSNLPFLKTKEIKYQFMSFNDAIFCIFNDFWVVPMEILKDLDLKTQRYLYFMKYSLESIYSEILFVFEITEEFLINYKGFEHFLEYKKIEEMKKEKIEQIIEQEKEETTKTEKKAKTTEEEAKALN